MTQTDRLTGEPTLREAVGQPEPDAHGQAALLLAESMLHLLVEARALTRAQAMEAVAVAVSVKRERAEASGESPSLMHESLRLLRRIERGVAGIDTDWAQPRDDAAS